MAAAHLNLLLQILLKTYFSNSRCLFIFTDSASQIQTHLEIPQVYLKINNTLKLDLLFQHHGCQDIIIDHENASTIFKEFEKWIRLKNERFNFRKYIITGKNAMDVFSTPEIRYVSDLLVVVPAKNDDGTEKYDIVTHYFGPENTGIVTAVVDTWYPQNGFLKGYDLFKNKLHNQNGRTIVVGTFTYEPYSIVDNYTIGGTESTLVLEFLKKYNLTPSFKIIPGEDYWGDIYNNWTGFGILGAVAQDEVELGYGSVYSWEPFYKFLDYTRPLVRTGVTALVPSPRPAAGWLTPLYSFSVKLWVAVLAVLVSDIIVLSVILYRNRMQYSESIMTIVRLYLLQSIKHQIKGKLMRYFFALNMLNVLLISSTYSSGLSSVMTIPRYEKAIKTVKDLAASNLPWAANTDAWLISISNVKEKEYKIIKNNFVVQNDKNLVAASKLHRFGFALERLPYGHFAVGTYIKRDVISEYQIMQEDIYWENCILLVRKNSVLLPLLNDLISRAFDAGLVAYWENVAVAKHMDMWVQRGIMYHFQGHATIKLKWLHVEGAFGILIIGYITSLLAFGVECIRYKFKTTNKKFQR